MEIYNVGRGEGKMKKSKKRKKSKKGLQSTFLIMKYTVSKGFSGFFM
jgi:hypothetical protein